MVTVSLKEKLIISVLCFVVEHVTRRYRHWCVIR